MHNCFTRLRAGSRCAKNAILTGFQAHLGLIVVTGREINAPTLPSGDPRRRDGVWGTAPRWLLVWTTYCEPGTALECLRKW